MHQHSATTSLTPHARAPLRLPCAMHAAAVTDIIDSHHYTSTADATVGVTLNATMDIGCDGFIPPALNQALTDGAVTMDAVDASLTNLFRVR